MSNNSVVCFVFNKWLSPLLEKCSKKEVTAVTNGDALHSRATLAQGNAECRASKVNPPS